MTEPAVVFEERLRIPARVHTLGDFRRWAFSEAFPEDGRIDFLDGDVEVEMSPEDLFPHGAVKSAISARLSARLHAAIVDGDRGEDLRFDVLVLSDGQYKPVPPEADFYRRSPCLDSRVRLVRQAGQRSFWRYRLDIE